MKTIFNISMCYNQSNYGQRLQSYALQKYLKMNFGQNMVLLDSRTSNIDDFAQFEYDEMQIKKYNIWGINIYDSKVACPIDIVLLGGDQIWNTWERSEGVNSVFTGGNLPDYAKRASYSASINGDEYAFKNDKFIYEISKMQMVSVRESNDAERLNFVFKGKGLNTVATYHIDPVLLLDKTHWLSISRKPQVDITKDYSFEYTVGWQKSDRIEDGQQIYTSCGNIDINTPYKKIDPREWIWLMANCNTVITTSFHGFVFGVIFNKKFKYIPFDNYRIQNLIKILNIRFNDGIIQNYDEVILNIEKERMRSFDYLSNVI